MTHRHVRTTTAPQADAAAASGSPSVPANWANVLASLDDAVIIADTTERVTFLNQAAETLTGLSGRQIISQSLDRLFAADAWVVEMARGTLTAGNAPRRGEGRLTRPGASQVPVTLTASPILDSRGVVEGTVLVVHDVSYRAEIEEGGRHAERAMSLELLSTGLAHEIKNPLGAIKGAAQLLQQGQRVSAETIQEHTAVIVREVDRLARLLDELRDVTHPPPLRLEPVNIHKVLRTVLEIVQAHAEWQRIVVAPQFDPSLPDIRGNSHKLVQVFLNLVTNAVQAMDGQGTLTISTRMVTEYHIRRERGARRRFLSVSIEDTGPGIQPGDLAKVFAPFFTTKPRGSGLGLVICQHIITQHGGHISLRNRRRRGAVSRVMLPVAVQ
jgi:PAS domain S-box-containing protein